ncbi:MAG: vitamin K epoxide reductase family protein [Rubricoccaceae bacterium]
MATPAPSARAALLSRIIFGAALFGLLVVIHLSMQARIEFAYGCSGLGAPGAAAAADAGCATVTSSAYSTFLGVSNIVWGGLFYLLVAGLRLAYVLTGRDVLRKAAFGAVGVGALYTVYLVYVQAAVLQQFCLLCMLSALTVATLLVLHVLEHRRLTEPAPVARAERRGTVPRRSLAPYAVIGAAFLLLAAADVTLASRVPSPDGSGSAANIIPGFGATPQEACAFDANIDPIENFEQFFDTPFKGDPDAPVRLVEVFDPNCPHCRDLYNTLKPFMAENGDRARLHYVAYPLRQESLGQIIALRLAQEEGKFFELLEAMLARIDNTWGMTLDELIVTANAAGMDGAALRAFFEDEARVQPVIEQVIAESEAVGQAFATRDGALSVPKIAIEGRVIAATRTSYSPACFSEFIDNARAAQQAAPAP